MHSPIRKGRSSEHVLAQLSSLLADLDPDVSYPDWCRALMVIFNETRGSEEGFELADSWSSGGCKYRGTSDIRSMWRSFKLDHQYGVRIGTLVRMVKGYV
jgi:hypothetical protein